MPGEQTATPVEASAMPMDDAAAEAAFAASGDGKVAPAEPSTEASPAPAKVDPPPKQDEQPAKVEPAKVVTADPVKAAEDRAAQVEQERQNKVVADEAARIEQERAAAAPAKAESGVPVKADFDTALASLKDLTVTLDRDGTPTEVPLDEFFDSTKGYGEVARGAAKVAHELIQRALAPVMAELDSYRQEKAQAKAVEAQDKFLSDLAENSEHKDAAAVNSDKAFLDWFAKQSPQMRALGQSGDIKDAALVLSAFKSATGWKAPIAGAPNRESLVEKQRVALKKADAIGRASTRTRGGSPSQDSEEGDIETTEDAEKAFNEAAKAAGK